jgi:hypothetical protein
MVYEEGKLPKLAQNGAQWRNVAKKKNFKKA